MKGHISKHQSWLSGRFGRADRNASLHFLFHWLPNHLRDTPLGMFMDDFRGKDHPEGGWVHSMGYSPRQNTQEKRQNASPGQAFLSLHPD